MSSHGWLNHDSFQVFGTIYDKKSNPGGMSVSKSLEKPNTCSVLRSVSLGIAENGLMHQELAAFYGKVRAWSIRANGEYLDFLEVAIGLFFFFFHR